MTADSADGFEYEPAAKHTSAEQRRHYWAVAIGLQRVDGLEVSPYLRELAAGYEGGTYTLAQTGDLIRSYHHGKKEDSREPNGNSSYLEQASGAGAEDRAHHAVSRLWLVHPFAEGNTRTVAVFSEMYLNYLGFPTSNEPFELHAPYFRGALVRANYRNAPAKVLPSLDYLIRFYDNVINNAGHDLNEEDLVCPKLFEHPELLRNIDPAEALVRRP